MMQATRRVRRRASTRTAAAAHKMHGGSRRSCSALNICRTTYNYGNTEAHSQRGRYLCQMSRAVPILSGRKGKGIEVKEDGSGKEIAAKAWRR